MRELERNPDTPAAPHAAHRLAIVGRGRMGFALATALSAPEPLGRDADLEGYDAILLCVPDAGIAPAAAAIPRGPMVGHCSGALGLEPLAPHEAFSLHPLMTVTAGDGRERLAGAGAAVAGSSPRALAFARALAEEAGLKAFELADRDRVAYHAAASVASNLLIGLEAAAEQLAASAGLPRELLVPLVRATVENWARLGARQALTGPIARGDETTVAAQREAIAVRAPELLEMFDALVGVTRRLAAPREVAA